MNRLVVALVGCGFAGSIHSRAINLIKASAISKEIEIELKVCVDADIARAKTCASQYGWEKASDKIGDIFTQKIDLLIIAVPNSGHLELVKQASKNEMFVLLEKPLSSSIDEAKEIVKIASKDDRVRMAFVNRFVPAVFAAKDIISSGKLGDIKTVRSTYLLNMRKPMGHSDWRFDLNLAGNGASDDLGSHHVDLIRYLISDFKKVSSMSKVWEIEEAPSASNDDLLMALYELENGAIGSMIVSRTTPGHPLTGFIEIDGTLGSVKIDRNYLNDLFIYDSNGNETKIKVRPPKEYAELWASPTVQGSHPFSWYDCFAFQMAEIVRLATTKSSKNNVISASLDDGLKSLKITEQMVRSSKQNEMLGI